MMASISTDTVKVGETASEYLDCSICLERLKKPKILDCLHSFCAVCLQLYCEKKGLDKGKLHCPQCRQVTTMTGSRVDELPDALELSAQLEEVTMQEKLLRLSEGTQIECQACQDEHCSTAWCTDCGHFLCLACQRAHEKMAIMKSHQIYTLAQLQSEEIQYRSKLRDFTPKCQTHTQQTLSLYCNTCQKFVCVLCIVLTCNNQTPKHSLVDFHQASDSCKLEVDKLIAECEKCKEQLQADLREIEQSQKNLQSQFDKSRNMISESIELEIAKLKKSEAEQIKNLDEIYKDKAKVIKSTQVKCEVEAIHTEKQIELVKHRMAHSTCFEVVNLKQKFLQNLQMLKRKMPRQTGANAKILHLPDVDTDKLSIVDSEEEIVVQLVKMQAEESSQTLKAQSAAATSTKTPLLEKWDLKAQILFKPSFEFYDVAALSNNVVVLADIQHRGLTIKDAKPQSSAPHKRLGIKDLSVCPRHVSVDEHDKIYVLDCDKIKIFSKTGEFLSQFTSMTYGGKKPSCLAVEGDLVAVGYIYSGKLSLYNKDTTLLKTISAPMINEYLTIYKKTFIYTSWVNKKLLSVDYYGNLIYSVDIGDDCSPNGVCCHYDGTVYVAVWNGNTGGIQQYSPHGQYIGYINKECEYPRGITVTQRGDMIVTAGMSAFRLSPRKILAQSVSFKTAKFRK